jgi:hypothetical protein
VTRIIKALSRNKLVGREKQAFAECNRKLEEARKHQAQARQSATGAMPCTCRFKVLTRPADQDRVDNAIRAVAVGPVTKSGTVSYPEYRFRVARLSDLDRLHPH